ncbi:MAG TPA: SPFH domain-containing protein [Longimicrobiaceae bacterium]
MIGYMKAGPTTYVIHHQNGRVRREGAGLSFLYYAPASTIVAVPLASSDVPFAFHETTADFQQITVQGQLTFRIARPQVAAALLDYTVGALRGYVSDDPGKLPERLVQTTQILTRAVVQRLPLREALVRSDAIVAEVLAALRGSEAVAMLGVEILGLVIVSLRPTPEIARALEAEAREELQRGADEAIYARRNSAVEQERRIRESELNTELAVQEKQRKIRESQVAADVSVERHRSELIETRAENERRDADTRAYALRAVLEPLRDTDWRTLTAVGAGGGDARTMIALAFRELAENAGRIGELNVTPDLLQSLLAAPARS